MSKKKESPELSQRALEVLRLLIQEHVRTGKPVGSRRLSKIYPEGVSSATLRNVMADLEELGYVSQPHTSAGRLPTTEGYRLYVQNLLTKDRLPNSQISEIKKSLAEETDPEELMNKASQLLSVHSKSLGFVLAPAISNSIMKHIEFVKVAEGKVLIILVTSGGLVHHRLIQVEETLVQEDLNRAGRYLVENFSEQNLIEIRAQLLNLMSQEKALYDRLLKNVLLLGAVGLMQNDLSPEEEAEVYLGGTSNILQNFAVQDMERLTRLFRTFDEKSRLVRIISECIQEDRKGPTVTIGLEKHIPGMKNWTLITSPYLYDQNATGSLGILGPSRMEYEKTISLVDYVARLFGQILSNN